MKGTQEWEKPISGNGHAKISLESHMVGTLIIYKPIKLVVRQSLEGKKKEKELTSEVN